MKRYLLFFLLLVISVSSFSQKVNVIAYNVLHGQLATPEQMAETLASHNPDIICFSEVPNEGWTALVGEILNLDYVYEGTIASANHNGSKYLDITGNYSGKFKSILSRYPLKDGHELSLSGTGWKPSSSAMATVTINGHDILIGSLHIPSGKSKPNNSKALDLANKIQGATYVSFDKIILAGDYNDVPGSQPLTHIENAGFTSSYEAVDYNFNKKGTFHGSKSVIDHLYHKGLVVTDTYIIEETTPTSDHKPVLATYDLDQLVDNDKEEEEVLLYDTTNHALNGTATQSSTNNGGDASRAIDDNTNGNFSKGSVTHTNDGSLGNEQWWEVDLGEKVAIDEVIVWNRTDCCTNRLSDYYVFIKNTPFVNTSTKDILNNETGVIASYRDESTPNPSTIIPFSNIEGRYVRIQQNSEFSMQLAEIQVNSKKLLTVLVPSNFQTIVSKNRVALNWVDNSDIETGFHIERKSVSDEAFMSIATLGANETSFVDTNPISGENSLYRLKAFNNERSSIYTKSIEVLQEEVLSETRYKTTIGDQKIMEVYTITGQKIHPSTVENIRNQFYILKYDNGTVQKKYKQ